MGLIGKIFKGNGDPRASVPSSQVFAESVVQTSLEQTKTRNAPRRDLVKVVLRETMRRHGIPSDWLECRSLSVLTRNHKSGMHVQFLVRQGDHELLKWVHAFQESFWEQILRTDPTARDWLFSVGWEFYGKSIQGFDMMPPAAEWKPAQGAQQVEAELESDTGGDTLPPDYADAPDSVASDLEALQALMSVPAELGKVPELGDKKRG
jgi:hypothetical protein